MLLSACAIRNQSEANSASSTSLNGSQKAASLQFGESAHLPSDWPVAHASPAEVKKGYGLGSVTVYKLAMAASPRTLELGMNAYEVDANVQICANSAGFPHLKSSGGYFGDAASRFEDQLYLDFGNVYSDLIQSPVSNQTPTVLAGPPLRFLPDLAPHECKSGIVPFFVPVTSSEYPPDVENMYIALRSSASQTDAGRSFAYEWGSGLVKTP